MYSLCKATVAPLQVALNKVKECADWRTSFCSRMQGDEDRLAVLEWGKHLHSFPGRQRAHERHAESAEQCTGTVVSDL